MSTTARLDWIEHGNLKSELGLKDTVVREWVLKYKIKVSKIGQKKYYPINQINQIIKQHTILN